MQVPVCQYLILHPKGLVHHRAKLALIWLVRSQLLLCCCFGLFHEGDVIFPANLSHCIATETSRLSKTRLSHLPSLGCTSPPCVAGHLEIGLTLPSKKFIFIWCSIVKKNTHAYAVYSKGEEEKIRMLFCGNDHSQFQRLFLCQQSYIKLKACVFSLKLKEMK